MLKSFYRCRTAAVLSSSSYSLPLSISRAFSHDPHKYHNIDFKLHDLNGLNFYLHDHHNTCETVHHHGQTGLKVRSDHTHATKETGDWFHQKVNNGGALGLRVLEDMKFPTRLHFAFSGDLELTVGNDQYKITNIVLGQGHDNGNNWWIGGSGKNFQRRHLYDANGNYPALYCHTNEADIVFTQCKTGVENCFAVTILKKTL